MSNKEAEKLIKDLSILKSMDENELSAYLGYNPGYISQARSRGNFPQKFCNVLRAAIDKEKPDSGYNIGDAIRKIQASNEVILSAVGELLAKGSGMTVTAVQEQLETLVKKRLDSQKF